MKALLRRVSSEMIYFTLAVRETVRQEDFMAGMFVAA